jgi:hypothetical protein
MAGGKPRLGIPINLLRAIKEEAKVLRNNLFLYRFRRRRSERSTKASPIRRSSHGLDGRGTELRKGR